MTGNKYHALSWLRRYVHVVRADSLSLYGTGFQTPLSAKDMLNAIMGGDFAPPIDGATYRFELREYDGHGHKRPNGKFATRWVILGSRQHVYLQAIALIKKLQISDQKDKERFTEIAKQWLEQLNKAEVEKTYDGFTQLVVAGKNMTLAKFESPLVVPTSKVELTPTPMIEVEDVYLPKLVVHVDSGPDGQPSLFGGLNFLEKLIREKVWTL